MSAGVIGLSVLVGCLAFVVGHVLGSALALARMQDDEQAAYWRGVTAAREAARKARACRVVERDGAFHCGVHRRWWDPETPSDARTPCEGWDGSYTSITHGGRRSIHEDDTHIPRRAP